ncbi:MAG: ABC transporter permease [Aigarchaeota archaeon]|nr:ABC transporter permease [Aigarchaeota archaeon]MDW7986269.1 ABC transporter permease [Nitrososphaerota archaeon]
MIKYRLRPNVVVKIERRLHYPRKLSVLSTILSILIAFGVAGAALTILGADALIAYSQIIAVFITPSLLIETIKYAIPIGFAALGLNIAFRMNFWNIGAEGQIYLGMFASTGIVLLHVYYGMFPEYFVLPMMIVTSFIAGGAWCALPSFLKAKMKVNEILTTLMMNYIAIYFVDYLIYGPWRDPKGFGFPLSIPFPEYAKLTLIFGESTYLGSILFIAMATLVYCILKYTKLGFELKIVGESLDTARYAGTNLTKVITLGGFLSGGFAGLGGLTIVSGIIGRLRPRASAGYGYTAIIVTLLSTLNPWLIIPTSIFFGGLFVAGNTLQVTLNIPGATIEMLQALIFLFILFGELFKRYKITILTGGGKPEP